MIRRLASKASFWLFLGTLALIGCVDPRQQAWNQRRAWIAGAVDNMPGEDKDHLLDTVQLEQLLLAKPDFVGTPGQLEKLLVPEKGYRDRIMYDAFNAYRERKTGAFGYLRDDRSQDWRTHTGFMKCTLWIYDESAHFDRPFPWRREVGFISSMFFIERDKVIGTWPLVGWKPLRTLSGGQSGLGPGKSEIRIPHTGP